MNNINISDLDDNQSIQLTDDRVLSIDARTLQIECTQGLIWVTWPDGNERVLKKNQSIQLNSKGIICIQAFSASTVLVSPENSAIVSPLLGHLRQYAGNCSALFSGHLG